MDKDDFFTKAQIEADLHDSAALVDTGVFSAQALRPFQEPVFVSLALKLHDLLQKLNQLGKRINFTDDVSEGDITDLVSKVRNAICHLNSPENLLDKETQTKFVFNMIVGKINALAIGREILAKSDYDDDIAFYYGSHRIYLKRHVIRILQSAEKTIIDLYKTDPAPPASNLPLDK